MIVPGSVASNVRIEPFSSTCFEHVENKFSSADAAPTLCIRRLGVRNIGVSISFCFSRSGQGEHTPAIILPV